MSALGPVRAHSAWRSKTAHKEYCKHAMELWKAVGSCQDSALLALNSSEGPAIVSRYITAALDTKPPAF